MTARVRTATGLTLLSALGCSGPPTGATRPSGAVGSHVWLESSTGIELTNSWFFDTFGPGAGPPLSGASCWMLARAAMSGEQLAALEQLVLIPLTDDCPSDGFDYWQLTVLDSDGSAAHYRDIGCSYLRVEGAMAMLPRGYFSTNTFPLGTSSSCPQ